MTRPCRHLFRPTHGAVRRLWDPRSTTSVVPRCPRRPGQDGPFVPAGGWRGPPGQALSRASVPWAPGDA
ncbi:hypothetical protein [Ornithinimicrobium kibberense]|uniref:hypothetical protein n=1 Tax=Ornithinimicrobium kibberense TaxID=282060 RepID=UPI0036075811